MWRSKMKQAILFPISTFIGLALLDFSGACFGEKIPFTTDAIFRIETIKDATFSPDGSQLAVVISRPLNTSRFYRVLLSGNDRCDVWLADSHGGAAVNITNGQADGAGYFRPVWSPDGRWLTMFS